MSPNLLSLDLGTTHCKAGLFDLTGELLKIASRKTTIHHHPRGYAYYDPGEMWEMTVEIIQEIIREEEPQARIIIGAI
jgi:sugar (pentulose or hexulose) kinase